ncbi:MAG: hypothetical protein WD226_12200 [Planctomycetota bacterium]
MTTVAAGARRRALLGAHRAADRAGLPWLASTTRGLATAVLLGLVRDALPPFAYGVFAATILAAWVAFALVGEWAHLLRATDEEDWLAALPATALDRRVARTLHVVELVLMLALPSALIAAALAPGVGLVERAVFALALLGCAIATAALFAVLILFFSGRLEGLWMTLQALGLGAFVIGLLEALGSLERLASLPEIGAATAPFLWLVPPAWFAAPLGSGDVAWWRFALPLLPTLAGAGALASLPAARAERSVAGGWLGALLSPLRALAARTWVRSRERATFELVYHALPREREVVLRSYPLVALPLVFLVLGVAGSDETRTQADFLAVVQFGAALYLPILMTQVPVSRSFAAAWLLEAAPARAADLQLGALKAVVVRFVVPLYLVFAVLTWSLRGLESVPRLTLPAFAIATLAVVHLWPLCVARTPLSVAPDQFAPPTDWYALLLGWTMGLTFLAIFVERKVTLPVGTLVFLLVVVLAEQFAERRLGARLRTPPHMARE